MDIYYFLNLSVSLFTLTLLEIVLGVDNLVFLSIISSRLPKHKQKKARQFGLTLAWVTRLILLASAVWLAKLTHPLFSIGQFDVSVRDLFLGLGGLFLLIKAVQEIHYEIESNEKEANLKKKYASFFMVIGQIAILDIIFSLDSVLTAIGLTNQFGVMALAITIAIIVMIFASEPFSRFIEAHPTVKMLALSFLILIGFVLIADAAHFHIPRGYVYFAIFFSIMVEGLNFAKKRKSKH